jgi:hypothetical protein
VGTMDLECQIGVYYGIWSIKYHQESKTDKSKCRFGKNDSLLVQESLLCRLYGQIPESSEN